MQKGRAWRRRAILARGSIGVVVIATLLPAWAQTQLEKAIRELNNGVANDAVIAVEVFSAADLIGTGTFRYDNPGDNDVDFSTSRLPWSHRFGAETNAVRPFVEGYLGYFRLKQDVSVFGPPKGELKVQSITATVGGGVDWQVTQWLTLSPRMGLAYSHVWENFDRNSPPGDPFANVVMDWNADALTVLPSFEAAGAWTIGRWDLHVRSDYTYLRVFGVHTSSSFIDLQSDSQILRNEVGAGYRLPWKLFGLPPRPFFLFARHDLFGPITEGFVKDFYEVRAGLELGLPESIKLVRTVSFSAAYYFHDQFSGYGVGLSFSF